jgi:type IV secretion system protein VirB5
MKRLKKTEIAASLALCVGAYAPLAGASGVPTIDLAAIAQSIMEQMETMEQWLQQEKNWGTQFEKWSEQLQKMQAQYKKMEETLTAMRGAKNFGDKIAALGKLPKYKDIKEIVEFLKKEYGDLLKKEREELPKENDKTPEANKLFDTLALQKVSFEHYHSDIQGRIEVLNQLLKNLDAAEDPGDKADLANRIAIEQAAIEASIAEFAIFMEWENKEIEKSKKKADKEWRCIQSNNLMTCEGK